MREAMQIEVISVSTSSSQGTPSSSSSLDGPPPLKGGHTIVDPPVATHEDSVAQKKLDMVQKIKFGNEPLSHQIMTLKESVKSSKEKLVEMKKQLVEAQKLEKTTSEYNSVAVLQMLETTKARELRHANSEMGMMINLVSIGTSLASSRITKQ
uniref:Uncharacterized protein n=1 Tax=Tanacetum cinerariifolium TaxID=118510 RepID=A0A699IT87_TANCI|nr:hypothetical protein [Tanacetum cinerariifolium]